MQLLFRQLQLLDPMHTICNGTRNRFPNSCAFHYRMATEKTKGDRVSETITILKRLSESGIHPTDAGYLEIKAVLSKWVHDGEPVATTVELARYGRSADIVLSAKQGVYASIRLRAAA